MKSQIAIIQAFDRGLISRYRMELLLLAFKIQQDARLNPNEKINDKCFRFNVSISNYYRLKNLKIG
jgi:hypothetical protein